MLNYETLLSFFFFIKSFCVNKTIVFVKKALLIIVLETLYSATYLDKSKG